MSQFDVFSNPGRNQSSIPFVLDIQSNLLAGLATRAVVPLSVPETLDHRLLAALHPVFEVAGRRVVMLTTELGTMPSRLLRDPVGNLEQQRYEILRAIDALLSGV